MGLMRPRAFLGVLGLAAALVAGPARAAEDQPNDEHTHWLDGTFSIQVENDKIANTDRHYTNGFRMAWVSDRKEGMPDLIRDVLEFVSPSDLRGARYGFSFGQTIFTPNDTEATLLLRDDRPYASWLFVGASLHGESGGPVFDTLDTIEMTLGVVGPFALGRDVQNNFHSIFGIDEANGWDNQLDNEPAVNLMVERRWRPGPLQALGFQADVIPHVGASAGNVFTFAGGGAIFRLGQGLGIDYGPSHIQPALSGPELMAENHGFSWYLFAGAEGRAVLRNIFIDGNSFADSHGLDHEPFVGDFQIGITVAYERARASLAFIQRSKEFEGQQDTDRFGALNLSWHF
jgi:lipid A 3-O-deacylase